MALISTGLRIITDGRITLPVALARVMYHIYHTMPKKDQGDEFGLYMKGEWDPEEATVHVADGDYYMPRQSVSAGFIRFDEEPPDSSWNVAIHRHPPGVRRFSGVDKESINQEFLASMIYMPDWEFPDAIINVPVTDGLKVQVPAKVALVGNFYEGLEDLIAQARDRISHGVAGPPREEGATGGAAGGRVPKQDIRIGEVRSYNDGGSVEVVGEADFVVPRAASATTGPTGSRALRPLGLRGRQGGRHQRPLDGGRQLTDREIEEIFRAEMGIGLEGALDGGLL